jgi:serine/threonine protein kinase
VNYIVLAIEHGRGGTLTDLIKKRSGGEASSHSIDGGEPLTDEGCAKAIKGILLGLKHIHSFDYVHRDMKPSNVVVDDVRNLETVKIVDFGLAIKVSLKHGLEDTCGTLVY